MVERETVVWDEHTQHMLMIKLKPSGNKDHVENHKDPIPREG